MYSIYAAQYVVKMFFSMSFTYFNNKAVACHIQLTVVNKAQN